MKLGNNETHFNSDYNTTRGLTAGREKAVLIILRINSLELLL